MLEPSGARRCVAQGLSSQPAMSVGIRGGMREEQRKKEKATGRRTRIAEGKREQETGWNERECAAPASEREGRDGKVVGGEGIPVTTGPHISRHLPVSLSVCFRSVP